MRWAGPGPGGPAFPAVAADGATRDTRHMAEHRAWHDDPDAADGRRLIRRFRVGTLVSDGVPLPCRFIIDGRDGRLVMPVPPQTLDADEHVLWLPEEQFNAAQALLDAEELEDEFDEARDRYLAYHGRADRPRWLRARVESVRDGSRVFDGEAIVAPNAARSVEPALCRALNEDRDRLRRLTGRLVGVEPETALAVGVDEDGFDVRAALGVVRVEFPRPARDAEETEATVRGLLTDIGEG